MYHLGKTSLYYIKKKGDFDLIELSVNCIKRDANALYCNGEYANAVLLYKVIQLLMSYVFM